MSNKLYTTYSIDKSHTLHLGGNERCRTYFMSITFNNNLKVTFESDVSFLGTDREGRIICFVNKKQVLINNHEPDLLADQLAEKTGSIFYPVLLQLTPAGKLLRVLNVNDIFERWNKEKENIVQYFEGDIVEQAISQTETLLNNEADIIQVYACDWPVAMMFPGFYNPLGKGTMLNHTFELPVIPYAGLTDYNCSGKRILQNEENDFFSVLYEGETSYKEEEIHLQYELYLKDYSIRYVNADILLSDSYDRAKKISAELVHLPEKNNVLKNIVTLEERT